MCAIHRSTGAIRIDPLPTEVLDTESAVAHLESLARTKLWDWLYDDLDHLQPGKALLVHGDKFAKGSYLALQHRIAIALKRRYGSVRGRWALRTVGRDVYIFHRADANKLPTPQSYSRIHVPAIDRNDVRVVDLP